MAIFQIPYSRGHMQLELSRDRIAGVLSSRAHSYKTSLPQEEIVRQSLNNPIQSPGLAQLAKDAGKVLLITSDHTRPVPSKVTLPLLLEELRSLNPSVQIKILIATGFHRATSREEMLDKFGQSIVDNEDIINHDCKDRSSLVYKGILPSGGELWLNSLVDWADLVISEGFIEPHFFAGFSGGRKSILPGISAENTVFANHCSRFIASERSRTGNLTDNPIHKDMLFAAKAAGLRFIMNVVIDGDKRIINAFAGDPEAAHRQGCEFVSQLAAVKAVKADIVVTSNGGYPLDQNIYQSVKGMTAGEACVRDGGVIIIAAACNDGHGGEAFCRWFREASSPQEVLDRILEISQDKTSADQWQAQILARILVKSKVILVSDMCEPCLVSDLHMLHARSLSEAMNMAEELMGRDSKVVVIPDGVGVIVE